MINKLRWLVFFTCLFVVCGASVGSAGTAAAKKAPASDMDPHMAMTKLRPLQPGDQARAEVILAAAKKAAERYLDYRKAEADGYIIFLPEQQQNVYHFLLEFPGDKEGFDPDQPRGLLYTKINGATPGYKLVGVMYMARYGTSDEDLNARIPLSIARWHVHLNMCVPPQPERRSWLMNDSTFGLNGSITTEEACKAAGGHFRPHLAGWMTHIYPFETDSAKIWSAGMDDHHGMDHNSM